MIRVVVSGQQVELGTGVLAGVIGGRAQAPQIAVERVERLALGGPGRFDGAREGPKKTRHFPGGCLGNIVILIDAGEGPAL